MKKIVSMLILSALAVVSFSACDDLDEFDEYYDSVWDETDNYEYVGDSNETEAASEITAKPEAGEGSVSDGYYFTDFSSSYGTAGKLEGTTVIVSIFVNDATTSWDFEADSETIEQTLTYLNTATEWVRLNAAKYGSDVSFVCDWKSDPDLMYTADFDESLVRFDSDMYDVQSDYAYTNTDMVGLINRYEADNIIFFYFFNTDYSCDVRSWTLSYSESYPLFIEFTNVFVKFGGEFITETASYAHEILHSFGAPDFYYAGDIIPQEFVDYCNEEGLDDIMFKVNAGDYVRISFTDLDAYYVGIGPRPAMADEWSLGNSQFGY